MATTYTLTTAPTTVSANGMTGGALIRAVGGTVYAGDDPGTGSTDGMPVYAGETCTWDPGRPLYLTGAAGASAIVDQNSGSSVFPAAGVASQLIAQNLPDLIAQRIAINGAPPIDNPLVLLNAIASPVTAKPTLIPETSTLAYQTLNLFLSINGNGVANTSSIAALKFLEDGVNGPAVYDYRAIQFNDTALIVASIPLTGKTIQVDISQVSGAGGPTGGYSVYGSAYLSYHVQPFSFAVSNAAWGASAGVTDQMLNFRQTEYSIAAAANGGSGQTALTYYPSYCSGPVMVAQALIQASGTYAAGSVDHYVCSPAYQGLFCGTYAIQAVNQTPTVYPNTIFGGIQPILRVNNRNNFQIKVTGNMAGMIA